MAEGKIKKISVNLALKPKFSRVFSRENYINLEEIKKLRNLLSEQKVKLIFAIKTKSPASIYQLAKIVGRDYKAVKKDIKALEEFGIVGFERKRKSKKAKPILLVNEIIAEFIL